MFNKPKFKIGDEVFVVIERGGEAEIHKTRVENHVFEFLKGWKVAVKKTWGNDHIMFSLYQLSNPEIVVENVFSNEEDAKQRAEVYGEEVKEKQKEELKKEIEKSISETEKKLAELKVEYRKLG